VPPEAEAAVQAARDDLRSRAGSAEEAQVRLVEQVDWPDSSLGCPQPDMMYAQVITPGYRVVLALGDQEYVYHTSTGRAVYCPQDVGGSGTSFT
jgi:hypothetical protein